MHRHRPVFAVFWRSDVRNPYIKKNVPPYIYIYIYFYLYIYRVSCITYCFFDLCRRSVWFLQNMCFHVKLIWTKQSQNNCEKDLIFLLTIWQLFFCFHWVWTSWWCGAIFWFVSAQICWPKTRSVGKTGPKSSTFKIRLEKLRGFMDWQGPKSFFLGTKTT